MQICHMLPTGLSNCASRIDQVWEKYMHVYQIWVPSFLMTLHGYHHLSNCSLQCISISPYVNDEYIANEWFNFSCFCFVNIPGAFLFSATLHPHGAGPPPTTASTWMRRLRKTPRPSKRFTLAISWSKKIQQKIQSQWTVFPTFSS